MCFWGEYAKFAVKITNGRQFAVFTNKDVYEQMFEMVADGGDDGTNGYVGTGESSVGGG